MSASNTAREIASWIASDPEYQRDVNADPALWVEAWTRADGLSDDAYIALLDDVMNVLPAIEAGRLPTPRL